MGQSIHFNTTAQLYENEFGTLAIRFVNNMAFEYVGTSSGKGFVSEAMKMLGQGHRPPEWKMIPCRKLFNHDQKWKLISSMGYLDGDEQKPALVLEVHPEDLGDQARQYLKGDLPKTLQ